MPIEYAFIARDMGDAQMLGEAARRLKNNGRRVSLLALGQAANELLSGDAQLLPLIVPLDSLAGTTRLGTQPGDFGGGQGHRVPFAAHDAARVAAALEAPVVVTGVVSRAQEELVAALRSRGAGHRAPYIVGLYDSLALNKHCFLFASAAHMPALAADRPRTVSAGAAAAQLGAALPFGAQLDELWVPLVGLVTGVAGAARVPAERVRSVGHLPTILTLRKLAELEPQRQALRSRLGVRPQDQLIFYAGGRDAPGRHSAARSFELLVRGALAAPAPALGRRIIIAGVHPAASGEVERDLLMLLEPPIEVHLVGGRAGAKLGPSGRTLRQAESLSTDAFVVAADVVATWNSTVASQAALFNLRARHGRHVVFVDGSPERDTFAVVEQGLADAAPSISTLARLFARPARKSSLAQGAELPQGLDEGDELVARLEALLP